MSTLDELPSAEQARVMAVWAETSKLRASCLAHRRVIGWQPAPMWWYHTSDLSPCSAGWSAPAPIPRDGPPWRPAGTAASREVFGTTP